MLISRLAPIVDLILSYIEGLACILVAIALSLKDVLLLVATVSLTVRLFMVQSNQPVMDAVAVLAVKGPAIRSSRRPSCSYCDKQGHTVDTCFSRKKDLQSQVDSIDKAIERKTAAKTSAKLIALDTLSQSVQSTVSNRKVQKALSSTASEFSPPGTVSDKVNVPQAKGPAIYVDTGAYFSKPARENVPAPPANYFF